MLIIAQPRSASTSLMDTIGKITGKPAKQLFWGKKPKIAAWEALGLHHSDIRKVPEHRIDSIMRDRTRYFKQHFPPTEWMLRRIKLTTDKVIILLRDPEQSFESYKKLGIDAGPEELLALRMFNEKYTKALEGCDNVHFVDFNSLTSPTKFYKTIIDILAFLDEPIPEDIKFFELSKKRYSQNTFSGFVKGKRVALIGPAKTLEGTGLGEKIDSYDIVIRMKQPIMPKSLHSDYGARCGVIYPNINKVSYPRPFHTFFKEWKAYGLKWIVMVRRKKLRHQSALSSGIRSFFGYRRVTRHFYRECKVACHCKGRNIPFTGSMAIFDLLRLPVKELYIAGFDFFANADGHYDGYNTDDFI